jgi:uncharacterized membrane protein
MKKAWTEASECFMGGWEAFNLHRLTLAGWVLLSPLHFLTISVVTFVSVAVFIGELWDGVSKGIIPLCYRPEEVDEWTD